MGNDSSRAEGPYPGSWAPLTPEGQVAARSGLEAITDMDTTVFLAAVPPVRGLEKEAWNFEEFVHHAEAALRVDPRLTKKIDRLVPKKLSEGEFWRLYYCHAYAAVHGTTAASQQADGVRATPACDLIVLNNSLLHASNDHTSNAIIAAFHGDPNFEALASKETAAMVQCDAEAEATMVRGIAKAVAKGTIAPQTLVESVCFIDVWGKTADAVAATIVERLGDAPREGCILVLQGLSGIGKSTIVAKLATTLPRSVCWSNDDIFRSLTLLAISHCEQYNVQFGSEALTPQMVQSCMRCLTFRKAGGKFDTRILGYGYDVLVSEAASTILREPEISRHVATVAEATQGEVVKLAVTAVELMRADGMNVVMEGRAQMLNYVPTPHRFELIFAGEPNLIGMRRAAQRMAGQACERLKDVSSPSADDVRTALQDVLIAMSS